MHQALGRGAVRASLMAVSEIGLRVGAVRERLRGSLWFLPTVSVLAAVAAGAGLARVEVADDGPFSTILFGGGVDGARGVLQVLAGSIVTVTSVTFSLTVVALTTAASQYSPRVLRTFLRDRGNQVVLSIFLATFAYSLIVLRTVTGADDGIDAFVPKAAVSGALLLALASVAALVYFIHHITQSIRVESVLAKVESETLEAVARADGGVGESGWDKSAWLPPGNAVPIPARRAGYIQALGTGALVELACEHDLRVSFRRGPGARLVGDEVLAWSWPEAGAMTGEQTEAISEAVDEAVAVGSERTLQEDVAFGLRQLVDIAIKALSPSINDPTTAVAALGSLGTILGMLAREPLGPRVYRDGGDMPRVLVPGPTFPDYLDLAVAQIALYGASDRVLVAHLLGMLGTVREVAPAPARRDAVESTVTAVLERSLAALDHPADRVLVVAAADAARGGPVPDI